MYFPFNVLAIKHRERFGGEMSLKFFKQMPCFSNVYLKPLLALSCCVIL